LDDVGLNVLSQADEDGILLFVCSVLSTTNKKCAEICAGRVMECNTANLIIHTGWAFLRDMDKVIISRQSTASRLTRARRQTTPEKSGLPIKSSVLSSLLPDS
jgi:hypothetical protein